MNTNGYEIRIASTWINRLGELRKRETVATRISKAYIRSLANETWSHNRRRISTRISTYISTWLSFAEGANFKTRFSRWLRGCWCEEDVTKQVRARTCREGSYSAHASHHNGMDGETGKSSCFRGRRGNGENKEGARARRPRAAGRGPWSLKTLKRLRRRVSWGSDVKQLHNYRKTITPTSAER